MKQVFSPIAVAAALALLPAAALAGNADRTGAYGVVGVGKQKTSAHGKQMDANPARQKLGNGKVGYTVGGGYRLSDYFAVEADVYGQAGNAGKGKKRAMAGTQAGALKSRAFTVSALGIVPIGDRVELFGRAGVGRMNTSLQPATGSSLGNASSSGAALQFGAGANVYLGSNSFLRTEWTTLRARGSNEVATALGRERLRTSQVTLSYGHTF